ncbi:MAG: L-fucose/L-arabinose isomerase family protein [Clostridiales bacterium]|nr:L-fucose/L-arabinose isomerase family protein [Clostridiales bacterium]
MNHRKVGLISTMSPDKTWAREVLERVSATHCRVGSIIEGMGFEVHDEGPLHRSYAEMTCAGKGLRSKGINALVIFVGTWTYANCAAAAAMEAGVPIIIWGDATPGTCGLVGSATARGAMAEFGIHANLVYGPFDDPETRKKIRCLLEAACTAYGLRGQIMGLGGGRSMGMVTAVCDPNEVRMKFGIEIDSFEQSDIIKRAEKASDEKAAAFLDWMKLTFGKIIAEESVVIKQIKLYLALKEFCEEKGYDFVAVKCLPELPAIYTTFCLAHAIMGDAQDDRGMKERFVFACEADINAALTMQMLKMLSSGPVLFTDLTEYNFPSDLLTTCNCGSQPTDFAKDKKEVYWEREGVHEFCWKYGGTCPQHVAKPGKATAARLYRENGKYEMLIAHVEVIDMPREKLKETIWERPHAFLKLLCDRDEFFSSIRSNHIHLVYGDYEKELVELCRILDIKPVVVRSI